MYNLGIKKKLCMNDKSNIYIPFRIRIHQLAQHFVHCQASELRMVGN